MRPTFVLIGILGAFFLTFLAKFHSPGLLWERYLKSWLFVGYGKNAYLDGWEVPLVFSGHQWRFKNTNESLGDCSWRESIVANLSGAEIIGRGWNKNVYRRSDYAVKKINFRGTALVSCMDEADGDFRKEGECLQRSADKFIKEIGVLLTLQNDFNVPQLHAYCIPADFVHRSDDLFMVTDVGAPLDMLHLVQMDWTKRLGLFREIVDFVRRIRPFVLRDLRRQQFIFNSVKPMYADFDDVAACEHCNDTDDRSTANRLYDAFVRDLFEFGNPNNSQNIIEVLKNKYHNSSLTLVDLKTHADELHNLATDAGFYPLHALPDAVQRIDIRAGGLLDN